MTNTNALSAQLAISTMAAAMNEIKELPDEKAADALIKIVAGIYDHMRLLSGIDASDKVEHYRNTKELIKGVWDMKDYFANEETKNED